MNPRSKNNGLKARRHVVFKRPLSWTRTPFSLHEEMWLLLERKVIWKYVYAGEGRLIRMHVSVFFEECILMLSRSIGRGIFWEIWNFKFVELQLEMFLRWLWICKSGVMHIDASLKFKNLDGQYKTLLSIVTFRWVDLNALKYKSMKIMRIKFRVRCPRFSTFLK